MKDELHVRWGDEERVLNKEMDQSQHGLRTIEQSSECRSGEE